MSNRSLRTRTLQVATGIALGTFAIAAQADPMSLQGVCHLTSIVAGEGKCQLTYLLTDDFTTPASIRKSQIKVDGIIVAQYVNDNVTPADLSVSTVDGSTAVACGVSHTVTAFIARIASNSVYEKVGSLPPVLCPVAP